VLSCDVIIGDYNTPLFYFSWKLHSLGHGTLKDTRPPALELFEKKKKQHRPSWQREGSFFKFLQFEWNKVSGNGICVIYSGFSAETIVRISPETLRTSYMKLTITFTINA
jgi:hypothetical protein